MSFVIIVGGGGGGGTFIVAGVALMSFKLGFSSSTMITGDGRLGLVAALFAMEIIQAAKVHSAIRRVIV